MNLTELLPGVQGLSKSEKVELIQLLHEELKTEENPLDHFRGKTIEIWSPLGGDEAARQLLDYMKTVKD